MKHIKIEVVANDYQQEELIALLGDFNVNGFEQTNDKLIAYFSEENFPEQEIIKILEGYNYDIAEVEEKNWNEEWERNFQPVVVEDFVAVRADFHKPMTQVQHEIVITPKMSFGTGHHATTYMMMQQMRSLDFTDKSVFDFGTGTGILAILAEKLGSRSIVAIDVDNWSIENAKENFERNSCVKIDVSLSTEIPEQQFDIILANINRNVILDHLPHLKKALLPKSQLLLSGLLVADETAIHDACERQGLHFMRRIERSGWISLLYMNTI